MSDFDRLLPPQYRIACYIGGGLLLVFCFWCCCGGVIFSLVNERDSRIASDYPDSDPPDATSTLTDEERRQLVEVARILEDVERKRAAAALSSTPPALPAFDPNPGDLGIIRGPVRIVQVLDNSQTGSFLATIGRSSTIVRFTQVDTTNLVDDRMWLPGDRWFYVVGPTTYLTVTGAQKTVMLIMQVDPPNTKPSDAT